MSTIQEELKKRGFVALCASNSNMDIDIYPVKSDNLKEYPPVAHISYSDIRGKNSKDALDFILSKLPKDETK